MNKHLIVYVRTIVNIFTFGFFYKYQAARNDYRVARSMYLDLLQDCLTGVVYEDVPLPVLGQQHYNHQLREYGWDWPSQAHTMIGTKRLANVRHLTESIIRDRISGDLIETGVWRGGACIMMRGVLAIYGVTDRHVWVADSFEGLPPPSPKLYPSDVGEIFHEYEDLSVSLDEVKNNFKKYNLLDDKVVFLQGWFKDTLPDSSIEKLALLRLDGDLYESTIISLESLYDKVSPGGYIVIDDYHVVKGCRQAVDDFCFTRKINEKMIEIDGVGIYWRKSFD
jgi:hypothetical protein